MKKRFFSILLLLFLLLLSGCSLLQIENQNSDTAGFSIRFIDVGQGDSALVCCDGHYMLIDGGDRNHGIQVFDALTESGVTHLDILVLSHMHADHIGGLEDALSCITDTDVVLGTTESYDSDTFDRLNNYILSTGSSITIPNIDDTYQLGSADVDILDYGDNENDSIVLLVTYGETTFLFPGDIEHNMEERLCEKFNDELPVTLLKVPHHGSDSSTSIRFLRMLMPEYAVISVGENNKYGHPAEQTLSRLQQADAEFYRTDINGDIFVYSDGKNLTITTEK